MIIKVPITGEVIAYNPEKPGKASGNPDTPVRPLGFNKLLPVGLCDFKWTAIEYDFENDSVTVEVEFAKKIIITEWDNTKEPPEPLAWHRESEQEFYMRRADTEKALRDTFRKKTADELYEISKEPRLKKPS